MPYIADGPDDASDDALDGRITRTLTHFICCDDVHRLDDYRAHMDSAHGGRSDCVLNVAISDVCHAATSTAVRTLIAVERAELAEVGVVNTYWVPRDRR